MRPVIRVLGDGADIRGREREKSRQHGGRQPHRGFLKLLLIKNGDIDGC